MNSVARTEAGEKWCTGCAQWHPRDRFTVNRAARDGLQSWCRESVAEARRRADEEHNRHLLARLLVK